MKPAFRQTFDMDVNPGQRESVRCEVDIVAELVTFRVCPRDAEVEAVFTIPLREWLVAGFKLAQRRHCERHLGTGV